MCLSQFFCVYIRINKCLKDITQHLWKDLELSISSLYFIILKLLFEFFTICLPLFHKIKLLFCFSIAIFTVAIICDNTGYRENKVAVFMRAYEILGYKPHFFGTHVITCDTCWEGSEFLPNYAWNNASVTIQCSYCKMHLEM